MLLALAFLFFNLLDRLHTSSSEIALSSISFESTAPLKNFPLPENKNFVVQGLLYIQACKSNKIYVHARAIFNAMDVCACYSLFQTTFQRLCSLQVCFDYIMMVMQKLQNRAALVIAGSSHKTSSEEIV